MNVLITGCSRGIGHGLLEHYLKLPEVKMVWAVTTSAEKLKALALEFPRKLQVVEARVSEESSKPVIVKALGTEALDLLINCAGTYPEEPGDFQKLSWATMEEGFNVNLGSVFFTTQACLPALLRVKHAKVASMTSLMGSIADTTSGGSYAYRVSKTALNMFNKVLANEYSTLTAVVLHPGWVKTDMGGSNAPTEINESVAGMAKVIDSLKPDQTGRFYDFEGDEIPW
ncbi:MAG: SDR family oxidoreductase [Bdellovibrionales bacterium]|nr:SDR family oxidoreductase [Oligoflexia bacterium]